MTPDNVGRLMEKAADIGYDFVTLPMRRPSELDVAGLARIVSASGIGALCTAGMCPGGDIGSDDPDRRELGRAHLKRVIACARDIGIRQINGPLYGPLGKAAEPVTMDGFRRSAENLAGLADIAAASGITLCVEILNRYETALLNTVAQGLDFIELANRPNIKLHLDTFHMSIEERHAPTAAAEALTKLGYFELDQSHRGDLSEGSLDLAAISATLAEGGYQGLVGVEAFSRCRLPDQHANALAIWRDHFDDADELARRALAFIRQVFPTVED
ncbi:MAG: sugar phosphate isomerase/epimerase family protein [Pseudomonadota bacterium]